MLLKQSSGQCGPNWDPSVRLLGAIVQWDQHFGAANPLETDWRHVDPSAQETKADAARYHPPPTFVINLPDTCDRQHAAKMKYAHLAVDAVQICHFQSSAIFHDKI